MFCPNCGHDCGEFKFCPECGTQLRFLESNNTDQKKELVFPEPPIGVYRSGDNYIQIDQQSLKIYRRVPYRGGMDLVVDRRPIQRVIKYSEIAAVSFIAPKNLKAGLLSIRDKSDRYTPLPTGETRHQEYFYDSGTVFFAKVYSEKFYRVYLFLKQWAEIFNEAEK